MGLVSSLPAQPPRRRMTKQDRRAQLLERAQAMFASHGFHHITMDEIAVAAQVSKPVLYRHFPSKRDLYLATIDDRKCALLRAVDDALDQSDIFNSPTAAPDLRHHRHDGAHDTSNTIGLATVRAIMHAYVEFAEQSGGSATLLFESDVTRDDHIREKIQEPSELVAHRVATRLTHITELSDHEAVTIARCATALARHAAVDVLHHTAAALNQEEHIDLLARFAWYGISGMLRREGKASAQTVAAIAPT